MEVGGQDDAGRHSLRDDARQRRKDDRGATLQRQTIVSALTATSRNLKTIVMYLVL